MATCADCAHCVELYTPSTTDSKDLTTIRDKEEFEVKAWIEAYWKTHKRATKPEKREEGSFWSRLSLW